ncbi:MAG: transposase [Patescibacteria group bacterium]
MRFYLDHNYYFITCRTFNRESFFSEDDLKQLLLDKILETSKNFEFKIDAYSILSNHYHLLFYLFKGLELKEIIQRINGGISYELNKFGKKYSSIWEPYHNKNISDEEAYFNVMGYIIGNPFKHGLVKSISELKNYKFCNYNEKAQEFGEDGIDEIICRVKNLNWEIN